MLLEIGKGSRVFECGTGSGSMTLFLSEHIGHSGLLHTFEQVSDRSIRAARGFAEWKNSYDLRPQVDKWPSNVRFGCMNFAASIENVLNTGLVGNFYDAIYLDMPEAHVALLNAYELMRPGGVLVLNGMHLSQVVRCLNVIKKRGLHARLQHELVIEPANRLWEIRPIMRRNAAAEAHDDDDSLNWTMRLEDRFMEKFKRGGLFYNYWQGFLAKFRKIK